MAQQGRFQHRMDAGCGSHQTDSIIVNSSMRVENFIRVDGDLRRMAGMRAERQQPLDARPVGHLLRPEGIVLGAQLQQALALREQVRVRIAHRLHSMSSSNITSRVTCNRLA